MKDCSEQKPAETLAIHNEFFREPAFGRLAASHIGAFLLARGKRWQAALGIDRVDTVLVQAVASANLAHLQPGRARLDAPDDARRPTSIMGISSSMTVDYSTARRRMRALAESHILRQSGSGFIAPNNPLVCGAPNSLADQDATRLFELIARMRSQGFKSLPIISRALDSALIGRAVIDFAVRSLEGFVEQHGSITSGSIWAAIIAANVRDLLEREQLPIGYADSTQPLADHERRPVSLREVAAEVNLPFETVRRHVLVMANRGVVEIGERGVIVPARALVMQQQILRSRLNICYLRRLFDDVGCR